MKTELEIVNSMLRAVNNSPVQSLEENISPDAQSARLLLDDVRKSILAKNWLSNSDTITIVPDIQHLCKLPDNILKATPRPKGIVDRGGKLYNKYTTSYDMFNPVQVEVLFDLPLSEIPNDLAEYIMAEAMYQYYRTYGGDRDLTEFYYQGAMAAKASALMADLRDRKDNMAAFTGVRIRYGGA